MKRMIVRFNYTGLRNEAHVAFNEQFSALVGKYGVALLDIEALYNKYVPLLADETEVLDIIRKSGITSAISDQDRLRDELLRGFSGAVRSAVYHFDMDKRDAAFKLADVLRHYGNIVKKTYDEKTAAIDDLLRELQTSEHLPWITTLGLDEWTERLHTANRAFDSLMSARYSEISQRPVINMKETRTKTDETLRAILDRIEALATIKGIDVYAPFIREWNAVAERYKNILAQEKGRRAAKQPEENDAANG
ncbi:MAG: DUF6261 family protein [Bacteroidales bacterium]|nr:DUF6261 family protein [Bacteroidales bacterium]